MISSNKRSWRTSAAFAVACFLAFAGAPALAQTIDKPVLEVPIPNVSFTQVVGADNLSLPWLGQYISGIYTFALGLVGVIASIMMIIGGFQYLTSAGDKGKVAAGKKRITDALIGMVLAFGSYALLRTINPELVSFGALQLVKVQTDPIDEVLTTTTVDTDAPTRAEDETAPATPPGSHVSENTTCPFTQYGTGDYESSKTEFRNNLQTSGKVYGTTAEKVVRIGDIAVACGMRFGNCGRTAGLISALATDAPCLKSGIQSGCNDFHGKPVHVISSAQRAFLWGWRCFTDAGGKYAEHVRADCKSTASEAMTPIRDKLKREITNWPESWAQDLQPGDYVKVYSGIDDPIGSHSLIFTGWAAGGLKGGKMQAISGSSGTATHANKGICVTSACSPNYQLLIYIFRP